MQSLKCTTCPDGMFVLKQTLDRCCIINSVVLLPMPPKTGAVDRARVVAKLLREDADPYIPTHHKKDFKWTRRQQGRLVALFSKLLVRHIDRLLG